MALATAADAQPVAVALARFLVLGVVVLIWMVDHWLDFNIRLVIPALLIFLLDRGLVEVFHYSNGKWSFYGGYSWKAISRIGLLWLFSTFVLAFILARLPWKNPPAELHASIDTPIEDSEGLLEKDGKANS